MPAENLEIPKQNFSYQIKANNFIFILIATCILRSLNEGHFINVNLLDRYICIHENVARTKQVSVSLDSNFVNNNQEKEGLMAHPYNLIVSMLSTNVDNARACLLCQACISNDFPNLQLTFRRCCVGFGTHFHLPFAAETFMYSNMQTIQGSYHRGNKLWMWTKDG